MLKFCGFDFELTVDRVLRRDPDQAALFSALDADGGHWVILESGGGTAEATWVCAPTSEVAVELVATGRASATDVARHSSTGWVEVVRVVDGHAVPDRRVPCAELSPVAGWDPLPV